MKFSKAIRSTLGVVMASGLMSAAGIAAAAAPTATNLGTVVQNGIKLMDSLISGALVVAVVIGVVMIISGLMALKAASHDMQAQGSHSRKGMTMILCGAVLLAIPTFLELADVSLGIGSTTASSIKVATISNTYSPANSGTT